MTMLPTLGEMEAASEWACRAAGEQLRLREVSGLAARAEVVAYGDFPAVEWTLHLANEGSEDTPILEGIQALDALLPLGEHDPCVVRYANGALCSVHDFAPKERALTPNATLRLQPGGGRSSSEVLPFFNVDLGGRGFVLAVGWTGEWAAEFARDAQGQLRVQVGWTTRA
jgi:alpha-galactosidase